MHAHCLPGAHHFGDELEELRLGRGRVAQQQHVDVPASVRAVGHRLFTQAQGFRSLVGFTYGCVHEW